MAIRNVENLLKLGLRTLRFKEEHSLHSVRELGDFAGYVTHVVVFRASDLFPLKVQAVVFP